MPLFFLRPPNILFQLSLSLAAIGALGSCVLLTISPFDNSALAKRRQVGDIFSSGPCDLNTYR